MSFAEFRRLIEEGQKVSPFFLKLRLRFQEGMICCLNQSRSRRKQKKDYLGLSGAGRIIATRLYQTS